MYNMTNIYECMKFSIKEGKKSKSEIGKLSPKVGAVLLQDGKIIGHAFRGVNYSPKSGQCNKVKFDLP